MKQHYSQVQLVSHLEQNYGFLETMLGIRNGRSLDIPLFHRHMERMARSLSPQLPPDPEFLFQTVRGLCIEPLENRDQRASIETPNPSRLRIRIQYAPGKQPLPLQMHIQVEVFQPRFIHKAGVIEMPDVEYSKKYSDRSLFRELHRKHPGYDEIIITRNGYLSDGTFTNLIICPSSSSPEEEACRTPSSPLLQGCRREEMLRRDLLVPRPIHIRRIPDGWRLGFINALNPPGQLGWIAPQTLDYLTAE